GSGHRPPSIEHLFGHVKGLEPTCTPIAAAPPLRSMHERPGSTADPMTATAVRPLRVPLLAPPWCTVPPTGYGGIEWVVASLADGLVEAGHRVTLFASGGSRTRAEQQGVYDQPPSEQLGDPWFEAAHVLAAYRERRGFDVVHDHTGAI